MPDKIRRGALGKGIASLLGDSTDQDRESRRPGIGRREGPKVAAEALALPIDKIAPNPSQPRKLFDEEKLQELANSIKIDGILQPIIVMRNSDDPEKFYIVAGERRYRAAKSLGLETIPAFIRQESSDDLLRLALIENIQRADLNVIEEAEAYATLIRDYGLTQEQCAERLGKERSTIANLLRLLTLPTSVRDDVVAGKLTMGHARALLSLGDAKSIEAARDEVLSLGMSVRQTEELCRRLKNPERDQAKEQTEASSKPAVDPDIEYLAESLRGHLQTKIKISGSAAKGKIEIVYFSADELERILARMGHSFS